MDSTIMQHYQIQKDMVFDDNCPTGNDVQRAYYEKLTDIFDKNTDDIDDQRNMIEATKAFLKAQEENLKAWEKALEDDDRLKNPSQEDILNHIYHVANLQKRAFLKEEQNKPEKAEGSKLGVLQLALNFFALNGCHNNLDSKSFIYIRELENKKPRAVSQKDIQSMIVSIASNIGENTEMETITTNKVLAYLYKIQNRSNLEQATLEYLEQL